MKIFKKILPMAALFCIAFSVPSNASNRNNTSIKPSHIAAVPGPQNLHFNAAHHLTATKLVTVTNGTIPVTLTEPYGEDEGYLITLTGANGENYSFNTWDRNYSFDGSTYTFYTHIIPDVYTIDITATYGWHYDVGFSWDDSTGTMQNQWQGEYELSYGSYDLVYNNADIGDISGNSLDFQVGIDTY